MLPVLLGIVSFSMVGIQPAAAQNTVVVPPVAPAKVGDVPSTPVTTQLKSFGLLPLESSTIGGQSTYSQTASFSPSQSAASVQSAQGLTDEYGRMILGYTGAVSNRQGALSAQDSPVQGCLEIWVAGNPQYPGDKFRITNNCGGEVILKDILTICQDDNHQDANWDKSWCEQNLQHYPNVVLQDGEAFTFSLPRGGCARWQFDWTVVYKGVEYKLGWVFEPICMSTIPLPPVTVVAWMSCADKEKGVFEMMATYPAGYTATFQTEISWNGALSTTFSVMLEDSNYRYNYGYVAFYPTAGLLALCSPTGGWAMLMIMKAGEVPVIQPTDLIVESVGSCLGVPQGLLQTITTTVTSLQGVALGVVLTATSNEGWGANQQLGNIQPGQSAVVTMTRIITELTIPSVRIEVGSLSRELTPANNVAWAQPLGCSPQPVSMMDMTASAVPTGTKVSWSTGVELDTFMFVVWEEDATGTLSRVGSIGAKGPNSFYELIDASPAKKYLIEVIGLTPEMPSEWYDVP